MRVADTLIFHLLACHLRGLLDVVCISVPEPLLRLEYHKKPRKCSKLEKKHH